MPGRGRNGGRQYGGSGPALNCSGAVATAAAYDPDADTWSSLPNLNTARAQHSVVSTGTAVYFFGGLTDCLNGTTTVGTLERWAVGDTAWTVVTANGAPSARYAHESAWTGSKLLIYGGASATQSFLTSGAVYDPIQNQWSDASCSLANCERNDAALVVTQGAVLMWGGAGGTPPAGLQYQNGWSAWTIPSNWPSGYDRTTGVSAIDTAASPAGMSTSGAAVMHWRARARPAVDSAWPRTRAALEAKAASLRGAELAGLRVIARALVNRSGCADPTL